MTANAHVLDVWSSLALRTIQADYGQSTRIKPKSLLKFGHNESLAANISETVWQTGGHETYATGNTIDTVSSDDATDTQEIVIEGHILVGTDLVFGTQTATLNGQNKVTLTTPLYRTSRLYNNGATDFAGDIYCYEDTAIVGGVPTDTTKIHISARGTSAENQSEKASTSFSYRDWGLITQVWGGLDPKTAATCEFFFETRALGKVWRNVITWSASSNGGTVAIDLRPYVIVPPNTDIRISAKTATNNVEVEAGWNSMLATAWRD